MTPVLLCYECPRKEKAHLFAQNNGMNLRDRHLGER